MGTPAPSSQFRLLCAVPPACPWGAHLQNHSWQQGPGQSTGEAPVVNPIRGPPRAPGKNSKARSPERSHPAASLPLEGLPGRDPTGPDRPQPLPLNCAADPSGPPPSLPQHGLVAAHRPGTTQDRLRALVCCFSKSRRDHEPPQPQPDRVRLPMALPRHRATNQSARVRCSSPHRQQSGSCTTQDSSCPSEDQAPSRSSSTAFIAAEAQTALGTPNQVPPGTVLPPILQIQVTAPRMFHISQEIRRPDDSTVG